MWKKILLTLFILILTSNAFAAETVLATDNFTDGDYTSNPVWVVGNGTWDASGNALTPAGAVNPRVIQLTYETTDVLAGGAGDYLQAEWDFANFTATDKYMFFLHNQTVGYGWFWNDGAPGAQRAMRCTTGADINNSHCTGFVDVNANAGPPGTTYKVVIKQDGDVDYYIDGQLRATYSGNTGTDFNKAKLFGEDTGQTFDNLTISSFTVGTVTADFEALVSPVDEGIILTDRSYGALDFNAWQWDVNGVTVSTDQNTFIDANSTYDYNVCLTTTSSDETTSNIACEIVDVGSWAPLYEWDLNTPAYLNNADRIDFNITSPTYRYLDLNLVLYNTIAEDFNKVVFFDGNLSNGVGVVCTDYNFPQKSQCYYDWNNNNTTDGNYYLGADLNNFWGDSNNTSINVFVDNTAPTALIDFGFTYGFGYDANVLISLTCTDGLSPHNFYVLTGNDTNYLNLWDNNATVLDANIDANNGINTFKGYCTDLAGNVGIDENNSVIYVLSFLFVNEDGPPGTAFDLNSLEAALLYSFDGNTDLNILAGLPTFWVGSSRVLRFEFRYGDDANTIITREIDFSLLDANATVPICVADLQTFYEQIMVSAINREVVLFNDYAECYNLASYTKFAYENALMVKAYTVNKPYYLYTYSNGVKILLALLDGTTASVINLDTLVFNQTDYSINIARDEISIKPKFNSVTGVYDTNTLEIYYKSLRGTNDRVTLNVYNGSTLLWDYTETSSPNEFRLDFYYATFDINASTLLRLEVIANIDGELTTTDYYFNTQAAVYAGLLNPFVALLIGFLLIIFGITITSYNYGIGWFGALMCLIAIGVLSFAPGFWYVRFAQAIALIIFIFIILANRKESGGII